MPKEFSTKKAETSSHGQRLGGRRRQGKPKQLKVTIGIDGLRTGTAAPQAFKASGNGVMDGLNVKKLDRDVATLIDSIVGDLIKDKAIPQMLKITP